MNAVCTYDLTYPKRENEETKILLLTFFNKACKKWAFQEEAGAETGYGHYQCRFSLKTKKRISEVLKLLSGEGLKNGHVSITSTENRDNSFYCLKEDTRVDGPWCDTDEVPAPIPWDLLDITTLRPWQEYILTPRKTKREINVIVNKCGDVGKSTLVKYAMWHKKGMLLPMVFSYEDLVQAVCDMPTAELYLLDVPRSINIRAAEQLWAGIEQVKNGLVYDKRFKFQYKVFGCPEIWVFTNGEPNLSFLTADKWKFWDIVNDELVSYIPKQKLNNKRIQEDLE